MLSTSGGTMTGNLTLAGTPPLTVPAGAADGYVWTTDADGNGSWQPSSAGAGVVPPAGDIGGTTSAPVVRSVNGVTTSGEYPRGTGSALAMSAILAADLPAASTSAQGAVKLAGDLGGTGTAPTVAKIQGTAIAAPPGGTTEYLRGDGTWEVPAGSSGTIGGVTVTGTAAAGLGLVATSSSAATWSGMTGTRPEWFGNVNGTTDGALINAAIASVHAGTTPGPVLLSQAYNIEQTITLTQGVNLAGTGQGNRGGGIFPDTFTGAVIRPNSVFAADQALVTIGAAGDATTTNPNGASLTGVNLSGLIASGADAGTYLSGCTGVLVTDTADVHMINCFLGDFDRPGSTGTCVQLSSATAGNGVGFCATNCIFSASYRGVYGDGAGVTDMRYQGNLWHSCTQQLTLGPAAGGGGAQITNDHFTYTGSPSGSYAISLGSQAGDYMISNTYVDKFGSGIVPVQLATAKGIVNGVHFLSNGTNTAASLVSLSTASQEIAFANCHLNANGSGLVSLLQLTSGSITTAPAGGVYANNLAFGTTGSFAGVITGSGGAAIAASTTGAYSVSGNVVSS